MSDSVYITRLREENKALQAQVTRLEHELRQLKRLVFGQKSERFVPEESRDQLKLFQAPHAEEEEPAETQTQTLVRKVPARKPVRQVFPSHLPREVVVIEPEEVEGLKKIGEEVTETLDYRPARITVIRRVRPKYVDPADEDRGVLIAPLPPRPIDKGMAEPGLLAHVVIEKYMDHLPLYRQAQRFRRQGITLSDSTLGGWIRSSAELVLPLGEALAVEALQSGYLQADETPIPVQDGDKQGKTHQGYYWVYHAPEPGLVVMDYRPGRGRDGPGTFLEGFQGALQSDGYAVYEMFDRVPGIIAYRCWAHARRYFFEARENDPERARHALGEIRALYDIERALRVEGASIAERKRMRQEHAPPILKRLHRWLEANKGLPRSPWGKAVQYTLGQWKLLVKYVEDGRIEIDNNLVENAIRPIALGRKNYLFAGSHAAAKRAAVIYSLLATSKKHEVNPFEWLRDVLTRIPNHPHKRIHELLPHHWKEIKR
jgi:transposase